ncbi:8373_t:CDS:2, partial [Racocetra fulgida]
KYDEDYINRHANGPGCKRKKQKSILCFFNSTDKVVEEKSEVEDVMDDDNIIIVDKNKDEINREENANIEIINPVTNQT